MCPWFFTSKCCGWPSPANHWWNITPYRFDATIIRWGNTVSNLWFLSRYYFIRFGIYGQSLRFSDFLIRNSMCNQPKPSGYFWHLGFWPLKAAKIPPNAYLPRFFLPNKNQPDEIFHPQFSAPIYFTTTQNTTRQCTMLNEPWTWPIPMLGSSGLSSMA